MGIYLKTTTELTIRDDNGYVHVQFFFSIQDFIRGRAKIDLWTCLLPSLPVSVQWLFTRSNIVFFFLASFAFKSVVSL